MNQLGDSDSTLSQRRADAAVLMAETSLQAAGRDIATADRYQVIVSVDASELAASESASKVEAEEVETETESEIKTDRDLHTDNEVDADHADDITLFDFEKDLRNDRESFNQVRKLSPTCYRFRVVDAAGHDIRNRQSADACTCDISYSVMPAHSTRVECREPQPAIYYCSGIRAQHEIEGEDETGRCGRSNRFRSSERALSSVSEQRAGYHAGASKTYAQVH